MSIRVLPDNIINQIAAGEVVNRPSSVVKELIENSIDAGANNIEISVKNGGASYISVLDDGKGMNKADLSLAFRRHATSKLDNDNLFDIHTFGFRGEALASIASVAKVSIKSRHESEQTAFEVSIEGGKNEKIAPVPFNFGTKVEVKELFFAVPARLKFLKAESTELKYIKEVIQKQAMVYPDISFSLISNDRKLFFYEKSDLKTRISKILGQEFANQCIEINAEINDIKLSGYIGMPSLNKTNSMYEYLFVNNRPLSDKVLFSAVKAGYADVIEHGRFPILALFINIPVKDVDVNVHPAKTEVRFRDVRQIRSVIVSIIRQALTENKEPNAVAEVFIKEEVSDGDNQYKYQQSFVKKQSSFNSSVNSTFDFSDNALYSQPIIDNVNKKEENITIEQPVDNSMNNSVDNMCGMFGVAKAQLYNTYIVSQAKDGVFLIDQHAVHERMVYEEIKKLLTTGRVESQQLLIPEIVELNKDNAEILLTKMEDLSKLGLDLESFGDDTIVVRSVPVILAKKIDIKQLIKDLSDDLLDLGQSNILEESLYRVCATFACYGSVRAGRNLTIPEMNQLLIDMEKSDNIHSCNHGRPTYVKLDLKDIKKMFDR